MKGISPLISAVLLIAFTMAIAALFGQFAPSVFNEPTNEAENQTEQLTRCNDVTVEIVDVNTDTEDNKIRASIEQVTGNAPFSEFSAAFYFQENPPLTTEGNLGGIGDVQQVSVSPSETDPVLERVRVSSIGCQGAPTQERTNFNGNA